MTSEERIRISNAALAHLKAKNPNLITPPKPDELDQVMIRLQGVASRVYALMKPVIQALDDTATTKDPKSIFIQCHKFYLDELHREHFSYDELLFITAMVHAQIMKETIV